MLTFTAILLAMSFPQVACGQNSKELERIVETTVERAAQSLVQIETVGGLQVVDGQPISLGPSTGTVIKAGYVVTASYNLRHNPSAIFIRLPNGERIPAKVVGTDSLFHLTILKSEQDLDLPTIPLANLSKTLVGHTAIAIGKAYDSKTPNLSLGIISAKDRIWGKATQTDAKISSLNYGGVLVSLQGELIGILAPLSHRDNKVQAGSEWYDSGIGFAVNPRRLLANWDRLLSERELKPGVAGISFSGNNINADPAAIGAVTIGSPARAAGIQSGDLIVNANGQSIVRIGQWKHAIGSLYAGDNISIEVKRANKSFPIQMKLVDELPPYEQPMLDIVLDKRLADPTIEQVDAVRQKDLKPGDRIVAVNGENVTTKSKLKKIIAQKVVGESLNVSVVRSGKQLQIETLTLSPSAKPWASPADSQLDIKKFSFQISESKNRIIGWEPTISPIGQAMLWILPAGTSDFEKLGTEWKDAVSATGIPIIFIESTDARRWQPDEVETILRARKLLAQRFADKKNSRGDVAFVIGGRQSGGVMAGRTIGMDRSQFAGLALIDAEWPSALTTPKTIPSRPLLIFLGSTTQTAKSKTESMFRQEKFPVYVDNSSSAEQLPLQLLNWARTIERL